MRFRKVFGGVAVLRLARSAGWVTPMSQAVVAIVLSVCWVDGLGVGLFTMSR